MSEWISVKDRLPEKDTSVLYTNGKEMFSGFLLSNMRHDPFWSHYDDFEDTDVTHWMPLPGLPK